MFILQNLKDFIDNPMGKGSNAIPSRQLVKDDLNRRYDALFFDKKLKKMSIDIYKDGDIYYFHLKVPSESMERHNTYDVVMQFIPGEEGEFRTDKDLKRYPVKFFSNSPSFTYTYAYAFALYGAFVEELGDKFKDVVFDNPPVTRNPGGIINYEKTIYFAARHVLVENKYLNKLIIDSLSKPFKKDDFLKKIRTTDKIELEIAQETRRLQREKEKKDKETTRERRSTTVSSKRENKIGGQSSISKKATSQRKITPRKSSLNKIKPR